MKVDLVVLILSAVANRNARSAIRGSWIKFIDQESGSKVKYRFLIGSQGIEEDALSDLKRESDDLLILEHVPDSYESLTRKVLDGIISISDQFDFGYLLKVDDDSFVNIPSLVKELSKLNSDPRYRTLYLGYFNGAARVKKTGPWAERDWILSDRYLPYARGGGYVIGGDLAAFVSKNSGILKVYANEDVAMGAWLAGLDVWYMHDRRFDTEYQSRGCSDRYLITHKQSPVKMQRLYDNLVTKGRLCDSEEGRLKSYSYNWNVPPSECCKLDGYDTDVLKE